MYAKGMTTHQISDTLMDIYGFEASEGFISDVTDKLLPKIEEWQKRSLDRVYPVVYVDAIHYSVRDNNIIRKLAAYVILRINCSGRKEVLSIQIGENENAKYWLTALNELKNHGVQDTSSLICPLDSFLVQYYNLFGHDSRASFECTVLQLHSTIIEWGRANLPL